MVYEEGSYIQRYVYGLNGERTSAEFFYYDETERTTDLTNPGENPASDFASEDISKIYYFRNLLDSTMLAMDRNGEIITHMTYDEWGKPLGEPRLDHNFAGIKNLNNYTGYTYDYVLDLYFAQNRFYNPDTRQFITQDPIKDGMNWYVYCEANPLVNVDWLGLFEGQLEDVKGGYGGIYNLSQYIKDRYGDGWTLSQGKFIVGVPIFTQNDMEKNANNCTLTAIARVLAYHRDTNDRCGIPDNKSLYEDIKSIARTHGYTAEAGTWPTEIDNIVDELIRKYGYEGAGTNLYLTEYTFDNVKKEIDANRPLLLNIAVGYYSNHTITVIGYYEYVRYQGLLNIKQTKRFLRVHEGWTGEVRYIEFSKPMKPIVGSLSTIEIF